MIKKVGVIGAGTMGSGIAQKIAQENIPVTIVDISQAAIEKGLKNIENSIKEGISRSIFTEARAKQILNNILTTTELTSLANLDLVIEAVFEDLKVKKELFKKLEDFCPSDTIITTNTSSFPIRELAEDLRHKDRFLGLHFFYPPVKNRLVELIPGKETDKKIQDTVFQFMLLIGKVPILSKDSPGFIVNRFFVPWLIESVRILEQGIANIPTIEDCVKEAFGIGIGPFELMNLTGLPIAYHSAYSLAERLGRFYSPPELLKSQMTTDEPWNLSGEVDRSKFPIITDRLFAIVFALATKIFDERIGTIEDIDRGAKLGLRWPRGPFEMMNRYGLDKALNLMKTITASSPDAFPKVSESLSQKVLLNQRWDFRFVDLDLREDRIGTIILNRPEAMNALNETLINQLSRTFNNALANPEIKTIVLQGRGKAFVAGADIGFFIKNIEEKTLDRIVKFTEDGHRLFSMIDNSKKLVITVLDGLALGGGAELVLVSDIIIATPRASFGFPETGIGIYPGLGGTQRLPRLIGKELARYLILTGTLIDGKTMQEIGLADYFVEFSEVEDTIRKVADRIPPRPGRPQLTEKGQRIAVLFSDENLDKLFTTPLPDFGSPELNELAIKFSKSLSYKAPIALKLARQLIDEGLKLSLEDGLKLELSRLTEIFSTEDAYEGLTSIGKRRPVFKGK